MNEEISAQLKSLNDTLLRIADALAGVRDPAVFDGYRAFRTCARAGYLRVEGIAEPDPVTLRELRGIDVIIEKLRENTAQFLNGYPCNNVLIYGPRGTGKSSAVKALLNEYGDGGLRIIEMPRDMLVHLTELAGIIRPRQEKFIVFCDDLAFDEEEGTYRQLKAILEGGLERRPGNMLIYATSNRRHLMPERKADNVAELRNGELHPAETMEEKLSLSDRFGLRLGLYHFDRDTYLDIVRHYAALRGIAYDQDDLEGGAMRWALAHGNYSGRTARQFIDDYEGRHAKKP